MKKLSETHKSVLEQLLIEEFPSNYDRDYVSKLLYTYQINKEIFLKIIDYYNQLSDPEERRDYLDIGTILDKNSISLTKEECEYLLQQGYIIPRRYLEEYPELLDIFLLENKGYFTLRFDSKIPENVCDYILLNYEQWDNDESKNLRRLLKLVHEFAYLPEEVLVYFVHQEYLGISNFRGVAIPEEVYRFFARTQSDSIKRFNLDDIPEKYHPIHEALTSGFFEYCSKEVLAEFPFLATHTNPLIRGWYRTHYFDSATISISDAEDESFVVPASFAKELKILLNSFRNDYEFLEEELKSAGFFNRLDYLGKLEKE